MVISSTAALDAVFSALSDATRRAMVSRLARGPASVSELAEPFDVSLPAISKHLAVLERVGLVTREKLGRVHRCRLAAEPLRDAVAWIERTRAFWEAKLDRLERHLAESKEETSWPTPSPASPKRRRSRSRASSPRRATASSARSRIHRS